MSIDHGVLNVPLSVRGDAAAHEPLQLIVMRSAAAAARDRMLADVDAYLDLIDKLRQLVRGAP